MDCICGKCCKIFRDTDWEKEIWIKRKHNLAFISKAIRKVKIDNLASSFSLVELDFRIQVVIWRGRALTKA